MLNYLFKAEFTDGTSIQQTQEDVSLLEKGKNQWYDVLNSGKVLWKLTLHEQKLWNPTTLSVDLITGNFELNGKTIFTEPVKGKKKIVRYMLVQKHFDATYQIKSGKLLKAKELPEDRLFYIGWESGKNKQVIGVK